jgi:hypothetical protein
MRKLLGKLGGAIAGPLLRATALYFPISVAFFIVLPEITNAQVWVSSGFKADPPRQ